MGAVRAIKPKVAADALRQRMERGSLNLHGVAALLMHLASSAEDEMDPILRLLARDVDLEADAMGEAEAFLNGHWKAVA
jgi:hypothetical protein